VLAHTVFILGVACSLARPHQLLYGVAATVYRRAAGSLIVEMTGSGLGEACRKAHRRPLACGKGLRLSMKLANQELGPCEGLQRGLGGSLGTSRYLKKNTGVVDGSLHLYLN
jgi:hypothetical protein